MKRQRNMYLGVSCLVASLAGGLLASNGCAGEDPPQTEAASQAATAVCDSTAITRLPFLPGYYRRILGQLLAKPSVLGETTAIHVQLPPPLNKELTNSLVRIVGPTDSPQVLFKSDALVQLGVLDQSPGKEFFTAFATLPPDQIATLKRNQDQIASGAFGEATTESVVFQGRSAIGRTINPSFDPNEFVIGRPPISINFCPVVPVSTLQSWGQSLFITDPAVVQDHMRTWDPCTGQGTRGGVWTFAHFIREMATGSSSTPEAFTTAWLSQWLNDYAPNMDNVPARTAMFSQVIQPWATASGVTATLLVDAFGVRSVSLTGPLNLDIAPFRLVAIVNRIDLGETVDGPAGYSGSTTSRPTTAGELRFIFNVVQPSPWGAGTEQTCGRKLFTTIFEYGVPRTGCTAVVDWARQWTSLQALPGFTAGYLAQLQTMTESVVTHGAAPARGNQNAINQIRTNEVALAGLGGRWELREFTLSDESGAPLSGPLRTHTVAQTPDDAVFSSAGADPTINAFINGPVTAGVVLPASNPDHCQASYSVPLSFNGAPFRGGNALIPPGHWLANSISSTAPAENICARHQFSLNTCSGCHQNDTCNNGSNGNTNFTHIDPLTSIPVKLSNFLTGGGPGQTFNVTDTQFGFGLVWQFADLQRRAERLWKISHCTSCAIFFPMKPQFPLQVAQLGPVPIDPRPEEKFPFKVGPITDLNVVSRLLTLRKDLAGPATQQQVGDLRAIQSTSH